MYPILMLQDRIYHNCQEDLMDLEPTLVTGASGVLGRAVVQALTEANLPVRRGVRNPTRAGADAVHLDYLKPDTFDPVLDGVRGLFLMARRGIRVPPKY
jgi:uncharacterized protein YbjT (DUF2867 family)